MTSYWTNGAVTITSHRDSLENYDKVLLTGRGKLVFFSERHKTLLLFLDLLDSFYLTIAHIDSGYLHFLSGLYLFRYEF